MIQHFNGRADLGNDHVIAPIYPYFDDSVPQRTRDVEKAKSLLGGQTITAQLHAGQLLEILDLAVLIQSNAQEAGFNLEPVVESLDTFYNAQWCPPDPKDPPCSGAAEPGSSTTVTARRRTCTLNAALKTEGIWNSSQYNSQPFDDAFKEFQSAIGVEAQKAACKKIETILNEDVPIALRCTTTTSPAVRRSTRASTRAPSGRCSSAQLHRSPNRWDLGGGAPVAPLPSTSTVVA